MKKYSMLKIFLVVIGSSFIAAVDAQWNPDPSVNNLVCTVDFTKFDMSTLPDDNGGFLLIWQDSRNSSVIAGEGSGSDIYMQHVDVNGNILWDIEGVPLIIEEEDQVDPEIISDGDNGIYIIWFDNRNGIDQIDFYMQHIDFDGNLLWASNGIRLTSLNFTTANDIQKEIVTDGEGGALICFHGHTDESATDEIIFVSRIDNEGDLIWSEKIVCNESPSDVTGLEMVTDGQGGAFITWDDYRTSNKSIAVQHINNDGDMLWVDNGILITTLVDVDFNSPVAAFDGESGVYIAWADWRNDVTQVHAQHLDENGNILWAENGVAGSDPDDFQTEYKVEASSDGGALLVWEVGSPQEIYAQKINNAGERLWGNEALNVFSPVDDTEQSSIIVSDGFGGAVISAAEIATPTLLKVRNVKPDGSFNGDQVIAANAPSSKFSINILKAEDNKWIFSWVEEKVEDQHYIYASKIEFVPYTTPITNYQNMESELKIYPNPNNGLFNLHLNEITLNEKIILIYNGLNELIYEINLLQQDVEIDLSDHAAGVYLIKLITDNSLKSYPVVVQ